MKRIFVIFVFICLVPGSSWSMTTLGYALNDADPNDNSFTVELFADFTDKILGWGLDFNFNNTALNLTNTVINSACWSATSSVDGDGLAGIAKNLQPVTGNNILLATLSFNIITELPDYQFGFGITPGDKTEGFLLGTKNDSGFLFDEVQSLTTTPVPVPGSFTILLLGLGMAGVAGAGRKKMMRSSAADF